MVNGFLNGYYRILAAQIIAVSDPDLSQKLKNEREAAAEAVLAKDAALNGKG